jgi:hypothetical protein
MLTQLVVTNNVQEELTFPIDNTSSGFGVANIEGLDPVKATLVSSSFALLDGSQFQASRRESRNIILTLSFEPDYLSGTVETLRQQLYKFFMTETKVNLTFKRSDPDPDVIITGRVESFDAPRFARDLTATISIICFNPDFVDPATVIFAGTTTAATDDVDVIYDGTVETGVLFRVNVNRALTALTFNAVSQDGTVRTMALSGLALVAGDVVEVSTVTGKKTLTVIRTGVANANVLWSLSPTSPWIQLFPGINKIRVQHSAGATMPYTMEYTRKHGGL